jgi:hypothetical protein
MVPPSPPNITTCGEPSLQHINPCGIHSSHIQTIAGKSKNKPPTTKSSIHRNLLFVCFGLYHLTVKEDFSEVTQQPKWQNQDKKP